MNAAEVEIVLPHSARLGVRSAAEVLDEYYDPKRGFGVVWEFFDSTVDGPKDEIEPADVLSLTALNACRVGAVAAITKLCLSEDKAAVMRGPV